MVEGIQHKLLVKLLGYNYKVEYKKGKENKVADALSRVQHTTTVQAISLVVPVWIEQVINTYQDDRACLDLITKLSVDANAVPNFTLQNGILRYKGRVLVGTSGSLKSLLLDIFHKSALGGHSGERATYQRLKLVFYWPKMHHEVKEYVKICPICQKNKSEHTPYPGLLEPLPVPEMAWTHISMDFIEGLPKSNGKDVILVVVDRLTKYAHFISLSHPYTVASIISLLTDTVFKLHGIPVVMVTDRERIFTSNLWQSLFKAMDVKLHLSTAYHPQTDGQTKRVNQCLENYLRCMCFIVPKRWSYWLSLAEWWYNTSYHTSLNLTPFQALYGFPPPMVGEVILPDCPNDSAREILQNRQLATQLIRDNLLKAQSRIKHQADKKRSERVLDVGDMVYLKIQPYRHSSLSLHNSLKLHSKFYGPFRVMEKVGKTAYRLLLPDNCQLHPVFHVSQLKKHIGPQVVPSQDLPLIDDQGNIKVAPLTLLERRMIPRNNEPVVQ